MHANLNIHIMDADIRDTKTRTASLREKKYFGVLCVCLELSHLHENV